MKANLQDRRVSPKLCLAPNLVELALRCPTQLSQLLALMTSTTRILQWMAVAMKSLIVDGDPRTVSFVTINEWGLGLCRNSHSLKCDQLYATDDEGSSLNACLSACVHSAMRSQDFCISATLRNQLSACTRKREATAAAAVHLERRDSSAFDFLDV